MDVRKRALTPLQTKRDVVARLGLIGKGDIYALQHQELTRELLGMPIEMKAYFIDDFLNEQMRGTRHTMTLVLNHPKYRMATMNPYDNIRTE